MNPWPFSLKSWRSSNLSWGSSLKIWRSWRSSWCSRRSSSSCSSFSLIRSKDACCFTLKKIIHPAVSHQSYLWPRIHFLTQHRHFKCYCINCSAHWKANYWISFILFAKHCTKLIKVKNVGESVGERHINQLVHGIIFLHAFSIENTWFHHRIQFQYLAVMIDA